MKLYLGLAAVIAVLLCICLAGVFALKSQASKIDALTAENRLLRDVREADSDALAAAANSTAQARKQAEVKRHALENISSNCSSDDLLCRLRGLWLENNATDGADAASNTAGTMPETGDTGGAR